MLQNKRMSNLDVEEWDSLNNIKTMSTIPDDLTNTCFIFWICMLGFVHSIFNISLLQMPLIF